MVTSGETNVRPGACSDSRMVKPVPLDEREVLGVDVGSPAPGEGRRRRVVARTSRRSRSPPRPRRRRPGWCSTPRPTGRATWPARRRAVGTRRPAPPRERRRGGARRRPQRLGHRHRTPSARGWSGGSGGRANREPYGSTPGRREQPSDEVLPIYDSATRGARDHGRGNQPIGHTSADPRTAPDEAAYDPVVTLPPGHDLGPARAVLSGLADPPGEPRFSRARLL